MKSKFPISRKQFALSVFLLSASFSPAQKLKARRYEVYGTITQFNYTHQDPHYGTGIMVDYYITKNISIRGGLTASNNYFSISTAPLFWSLLGSKPSKRRPQNDYLTKGNFKNNFRALTILLLLSDGFTYSIKASKSFYVCPYIAPLQYKELFPKGIGDLGVSLLTSSTGLGLKKYFSNKLVIYAGAEVSTSSLFKGSGWGYRFNVSAGWVINHK